MRIHVICTQNGQLNEGMNNIEAHLTKRFIEKGHNVTYSPLKDIHNLLKCAGKVDCILIFARPNYKTYGIAAVASTICKNTWFFIVQRPEKEFINLNRLHTLHCNYWYLSENDIKQVRVGDKYKKIKFGVGLNTNKFIAVSKEESYRLKIKYGFNTDKPLVVHVGHASVGRGVEDLAKVDKEKYQTLFVDSGLFENPEQRLYLEQNQVKVISGYLEHIEEIYQMADAYLFPTQDGNYVISIPLSVMEALSCGTAAITYKNMDVPSRIPEHKENSIIEIKDVAQIDDAIQNTICLKREETLLSDTHSWDEIADAIEAELKRRIIR